MSALGSKLIELKSSQESYDAATENLNDWNDRLEVITSKSKANPSTTLSFLAEQARINKDLAQETHDREKHLYERTIQVRKEAQAALAQLDRITLSSATHIQAKANRQIRLTNPVTSDVMPVTTEMQRELDHAEYYIQALTELTLEK